MTQLSERPEKSHNEIRVRILQAIQDKIDDARAEADKATREGDADTEGWWNGRWSALLEARRLVITEFIIANCEARS